MPSFFALVIAIGIAAMTIVASVELSVWAVTHPCP